MSFLFQSTNEFESSFWLILQQQQLQQPHQDQMVKMEFGQLSQNPMMGQPGNQMPVPVQQMQPDGMQQPMPMPMPMQQNDFNKMMQQRMKLNPQAQVSNAVLETVFFCSWNAMKIDLNEKKNPNQL